MSLRPTTYTLILLLGVGLDQFSKYFSANPIINTGVSFSLLSAVPVEIATVGIGFFLFAAAWTSLGWTKRNRFLLTCHAVFFSGALSNWLDRLFLGGVRDIWTIPVIGIQNNLADWMIVAAAIAAGSVIMRPDEHFIRR